MGCPDCKGVTKNDSNCKRFASCRIDCVDLCWQHAVAYKSSHQKGITGSCVKIRGKSRRGKGRPNVPFSLGVPPVAWNDGVFVKKSNLGFAGKGLFSKRDFEKGEIVATYGGVLMHTDEWKRLPVDLRGYGLGIPGNTEFIIDGMKGYGSQKGRFANDSHGSDYTVNVKQKWFAKEKILAFVSKRDIDKNDEIFFNYGVAFRQRLGATSRN